MYHVAEEFALWVFSLSFDEVAIFDRVCTWHAIGHVLFFMVVCCSWADLRHEPHAFYRFLAWLHRSRRRAAVFSALYFLYSLPMAGAAVVEHAAHYSPRVQPAYQLAAAQSRLTKDTAQPQGLSGNTNRDSYMRIFTKPMFFFLLPFSLLAQVFWWFTHVKVRTTLNDDD